MWFIIIYETTMGRSICLLWTESCPPIIHMLTSYPQQLYAVSEPAPGEWILGPPLQFLWAPLCGTAALQDHVPSPLVTDYCRQDCNSLPTGHSVSSYTATATSFFRHCSPPSVTIQSDIYLISPSCMFLPSSLTPSLQWCNGRPFGI